MQEKYEILLQATGKMADGNLEVEINDDLGVFEPLKGEITPTGCPRSATPRPLWCWKREKS